MVLPLLLVAVTSFLSVFALPALGGCSLSSVCLPWPWLLRCWLALLLVSLSTLSVLGSLCAPYSVAASWPPSAVTLCLFYLPFFVTRSNLSSFTTASSLWAESALSIVAFVSVSSCLGSLCPLLLGPLCVLVVYPPLSFVLGSVECPLRRLSPLASSLALYLPWRFVPSSAVLSSFFSSLLCSLTFPGFLRSLFFLRVLLGCYVPLWVQFSYSFLFLSCNFFYWSWRRASGKFHSPPILLRAAFGCCAWPLQLSPLVRGDSTDSSQP